MFYPATFYSLGEIINVFEKDMEFIPLPTILPNRKFYNTTCFDLCAINVRSKHVNAAVDFIFAIDKVGGLSNMVNRQNVKLIMEERNVREENRLKVLNVLKHIGYSYNIFYNDYLGDVIGEECENYLKDRDVNKAVENIVKRVDLYLNE